ncbi:MAG: TIGR03987 family protein [Gammaproteobacteria bacterium]|nr:TIGR03987 family protein [Gammaproteobacteria bacterium]
MSTTALSVIFIVTAFVLYTVAVWSERFAARLKPWHVVVFWLGFVADTAGTGMMMQIARASGVDRGLVSAVHGTTGMLALVLMLIHCGWATLVLLRKDEQAIRNFHQLSTIVWGVWLIPFLIGAGMQRFR